MKTETNHTRTPWAIAQYGNLPISGHLSIKHGAQTVARIDLTPVFGLTPEIYGNAQFIVRACNCHEELLEALQECAIALHKSQRYGPAEHQANVLCAFEAAQATIAKAEGQ